MDIMRSSGLAGRARCDTIAHELALANKFRDAAAGRSRPRGRMSSPLTCCWVSGGAWAGGSPVCALRGGPGLKPWSGLALLASLSIEFRLPVGVDLCVGPFSSLTTRDRASGLCTDPWELFGPSRPPASALSWCFFDLKRKAMAVVYNAGAECSMRLEPEWPGPGRWQSAARRLVVVIVEAAESKGGRLSATGCRVVARAGAEQGRERRRERVR